MESSSLLQLFLLAWVLHAVVTSPRFVMEVIHAAGWLTNQGYPRLAIPLYGWVRSRFDDRLMRALFEGLTLHACLGAGRGLTRARVHAMLAELRPEEDDEALVADIANSAVNALIALGAYADALAVGEDWPAAAHARLAAANPADLALVELNKVEALYNTGDWAGSLARLDRLVLPPEASPLVRSGWIQQRAWILARLGRVDEARAAIDAAVEADLGSLYLSEHHFTHAAVRLAAGDVAGARAAAEAGRRLARRAGSRRNADVLMARVALAEGDLPAAEAACSRAARHVVAGQHGDGLLLHGDILARLGRAADARAAWSAAVARDGESEAARLAGERLAGLSASA